MTGTAVKMTEVPWQMAPAGLAEIVTLTGRFGFTVMVMVFEMAGLPVAQLRLEVRVQVTVFPFVRPAFV